MAHHQAWGASRGELTGAVGFLGCDRGRVYIMICQGLHYRLHSLLHHELALASLIPLPCVLMAEGSRVPP
jgi:hypothetical protein